MPHSLTLSLSHFLFISFILTNSCVISFIILYCVLSVLIPFFIFHPSPPLSPPSHSQAFSPSLSLILILFHSPHSLPHTLPHSPHTHTPSTFHSICAPFLMDHTQSILFCQNFFIKIERKSRREVTPNPPPPPPFLRCSRMLTCDSAWMLKDCK